MKIQKVFPFVFLMACSSPQKKDEPVAAPEPGKSIESPALTASMNDMKASLEKLLPLLIDPNAFQDPKNRGDIAAQINWLKDIAGKVSHSPIKQKLDPSFAFLSDGLSDEIKRANEAFASGKSEYTRYSLMNVTSYCIECHTRTSSGPSFTNPEFNDKLGRLKPLEKGEFLLATRQYDLALAEFLKVIEAGSKQGHFLDLDRAVRYAMAVTVKYMSDPAKTEVVIQKIRSVSNIPYYLKQASLTWTAAVNEWKDELRKAAKKKSAKTSETLAKADSLIKRGRQAQMTISDRSGDVYLLRGLSILHQVLVTPLDKAQLGKALYYTGLAYEAVRDLALWSIHENYFETCVRRVPHSTWAMSCYKSLEESLVIGFTGSSGTRLPEDVQARLSELESLARPETR